MLKYSVNFIDGPKITIDKSNEKGYYNIFFKDNDTNKIIYKDVIEPGQYSKSNIKYYKNWNIKVEKDDNILLDYDINLKNKIVVISLESKSIGDSLAWTPYAEEFRKKHNCITYISTFKNDLFEEQYENIHFIKPGTNIDNIFAKYHIGWFNPYINKNPYDFKKIPLQKTATDILGLDYVEIIPKIKKPKNVNPPYNNKYVCIAQYSTSNAKHWHYPVIDSEKGWQILVDWLNYCGYKVVVISKQPTKLKNIIDRTGDFPLDWRIQEIMFSDFFIGIGILFQDAQRNVDIISVIRRTDP